MEKITDSHRRMLTASEIDARIAHNQWLINIAAPYLNRVVRSMAQESAIFFLLDTEGCIIDICCSNNRCSELSQAFVFPGTFPAPNSALSIAIDKLWAGSNIEPSIGSIIGNKDKEWVCMATILNPSPTEEVGIIALCLPKKHNNKVVSTVLSLCSHCIEQEIAFIEDKNHAKKIKDQQLLLFNLYAQADLVVNNSKNVLLISERACNLLGLKRHDIENKSIENFIPSWNDISFNGNRKKEIKNVEIGIVNTPNCGSYLLSARVIKPSLGRSTETLCNLRSMSQVLNEANKYIGYFAEKTFDDIIAISPIMKRTLKEAKNIAKQNLPLYILGEQHTGKLSFAQAIHNASNRNTHGFVKINLHSLSHDEMDEAIWGYKKDYKSYKNKATKHGALEFANGGTLYIEEIGLLPEPLQDKLIVTLLTGKFTRLGENISIKSDVRLIASNSEDLSGKIESGDLKIDFFYLISKASLRIPSLWERKNDIPFLLNHFLEVRSKKLQCKIPEIPKSILLILKRYEWPENFKEMKEFVERLLLDQGAMFKSFKNERDFKKRHLYLESLKEVESITTLDEHEKLMVIKAYRAFNGSVSKTSRKLGVSRNTLYLKLKKYGIEEIGAQ